MQNQKYFIKGMVCERCIRSVKEIAASIGAHVTDINLGEIALETPLEIIDEKQLEARLTSLGFTLLKDKKKQQVQETKTLVTEVYSGNFDFPHRFRFSEFASYRLNKDYESISSIFSHSEGLTLEKFVINYRIGKVKELLIYTDNSLADISFSLGFSSLAHLSKQFKMQTGLNPSYFRTLRLKKSVSKEKNSAA